MRELASGALRWALVAAALIAVLVLAVPAALEALSSTVATEPGAFEEADPPSAELPSAELPSTGQPPVPGTSAVADGSAFPLADAHVSAGTVQASVAPSLQLGPGAGDAIVLAFSLIPGPAACIQAVRVDVTVQAATSPQELALFPSGMADLAGLVEGTAVTGPPTLQVAGRSPVLTDGTPTRLSWDATELYQQWVTGVVDGQTVPAGAPFSVALAAPLGDADPDRLVTVGAAEGSVEEAPQLAWFGVPGCG